MYRSIILQTLNSFAIRSQGSTCTLAVAAAYVPYVVAKLLQMMLLNYTCLNYASLNLRFAYTGMQACIDDTFCPFNHIITRKRYRFACIFFCVMYIKMLLNGIRIVKISYFRKAYWKEKQVCLGKMTGSVRLTNKVVSISPHDFIVRVNTNRCTSGGHRLKDIKCSVPLGLFSGGVRRVEVPAAYCYVCDKYYILDEDYRMLKKKGVVLCHIDEKEELVKDYDYDDCDFELNKESLLHKI